MKRRNQRHHQRQPSLPVTRRFPDGNSPPNPARLPQPIRSHTKHNCGQQEPDHHQRLKAPRPHQLRKVIGSIAMAENVQRENHQLVHGSTINVAIPCARISRNVSELLNSPTTAASLALPTRPPSSLCGERSPESFHSRQHSTPAPATRTSAIAMVRCRLKNLRV